MKNTIEIKIECKGNAVGTLGWFNSIIENSELAIKETKNGSPGMFLKGIAKDGKTTSYQFICKVRSNINNDDDAHLDTYLSGKYSAVQAESTDYIDGFSDYPLTPACLKKVNEFIEMAVEKFAEWWENN